MDWNDDMDAAPRDGRIIHAWAGVILPVYWQPDETVTETKTVGIWPFRRAVTEEKTTKGGWQLVTPMDGGYARFHMRFSAKITHWMPLPEPPK